MASDATELWALPILDSGPWQMSHGERAALEGFVCQMAPKLAVEIGTAEGGSLKRIAAHSEEVHSFDLVVPADDVARLENVTFHTGDSHQLLSEFLERMTEEQRQIDFVLIDGDHSADGVRRDIVDLLGSDAVSRTVIVLHDTLNPEVRHGIEAANIADHPKAALYELDLVPGYLARREPYRLQLWGGLGLIVVDANRRHAPPSAVIDTRFHPLFGVISPMVDIMVGIEARGKALDGLRSTELESVLRRELSGAPGQEAAEHGQIALRRELAESRQQTEHLAAQLAAIQRSWGSRAGAALRELKRIVRER